MQLTLLIRNLNIYLYNNQIKTAIFIATRHEKNNYGSCLNFYKYFLYFELLASNTIKNEIEKFKNLIRTNQVKYSSKFLDQIKNIWLIQAHQQMFKMIA